MSTVPKKRVFHVKGIVHATDIASAIALLSTVMRVQDIGDRGEVFDYEIFMSPTAPEATTISTRSAKPAHSVVVAGFDVCDPEA